MDVAKCEAPLNVEQEFEMASQEAEQLLEEFCPAALDAQSAQSSLNLGDAIEALCDMNKCMGHWAGQQGDGQCHDCAVAGCEFFYDTMKISIGGFYKCDVDCSAAVMPSAVVALLAWLFLA